MTDTPQSLPSGHVPGMLLAHHLKALKLPTILREYDKIARQCAAEGVDYPRYLLRLVEAEIIERDRRMVDRRIKAAKFPTVKSLDSFDFAAFPDLNKALVMELARSEYVERRENIMPEACFQHDAVGNSGTGKSHIGLGLGLAACQKGLSVGFTNAAAIVHELIEARDEKRLLRLQRQLAAYKLLIVDELGYVPLSQTGAELLFEVFSQRYERGSTIVTSNLPFAAFADDLEAHNGDASRIKEVCIDMSGAFIKGVDYNLTEAEITFDKFHAVKLVNDAVDKVRRAESKDRPELKRSRYLWLKNERHLSAEQSASLAALSSMHLKTARAYRLRLAFQDIYDQPSPGWGELILDRWYSWAIRSRLEPMKDAARTVMRHRDGILRWFTSKIANGLIEGINSLVQAAKAKARGYRSTRNLKAITYLIAGKLDLRLPT